MRRVVLGAYSYLEFGVLLLLWLPILGAVTLLDRSDVRRRGRWMRRFGRLTARLTPLWRFRIEGRGPVDIDRRAYVVVANHQSSADPFLLSSLPWDMRWIAKVELFRAPPIGWLMRMGGDLPVERGDGPSVRAMMADAKATLDGGLSLMIFPEGTRSKDGALGRFKDGAFELAIAAGVPILPVVLDGTHTCRPKGSWWFGDADAVARVLAPIPTTGMGAGDVAALRELTRARIAEELPRLVARLPAAPAPSVAETMTAMQAFQELTATTADSPSMG